MRTFSMSDLYENVYDSNRPSWTVCLEQHLLPFLYTHIASLRRRIEPEVMVAHGMVENGTELIVDGLEIDC